MATSLDTQPELPPVLNPSSFPPSAISLPRPSRPPAISVIPAVNRESVASLPPVAMTAPGGGRFDTQAARKGAMLAAAGLLLVVAALFGPSTTGSLVLTVSGPGGVSVRGLSILVDGKLRCDKSPCLVKELPEGARFIAARAPGYGSTEASAIRIEPGESAAYHITLEKNGMGSGLSIQAAGAGLSVYVDGNSVGSLPRKHFNVSPGSHRVSIRGQLYENYDLVVNVDEFEPTVIGPLRMTQTKRALQLTPGKGAKHAQIVLDGRHVPTLPATIALALDRPHTISARRKGYQAYEKTVQLLPGTDPMVMKIALSPATYSERPRPKPVVRHKRPAPAKAPVSSSRGHSTLNVNAIPMASVVIDGKPMGHTPIMGIRVGPGVHTVVFNHPELGRKVTSVSVNPGATKTVAVRFQ